MKETTSQKSRSLSNLVIINEIDVNEHQKQMFGIPKNIRRKSLDLTKINIDSDEEKVEEYQQLMPVIKISQYNSTNGLNILHK